MITLQNITSHTYRDRASKRQHHEKRDGELHRPNLKLQGAHPHVVLQMQIKSVIVTNALVEKKSEAKVQESEKAR